MATLDVIRFILALLFTLGGLAAIISAVVGVYRL